MIIILIILIVIIKGIFNCLVVTISLNHLISSNINQDRNIEISSSCSHINLTSSLLNNLQAFFYSIFYPLFNTDRPRLLSKIFAGFDLAILESTVFTLCSSLQLKASGSIYAALKM